MTALRSRLAVPAIALCGLVTIAAASGWLPGVLAYGFKPLTTLLVIALAWPRGRDTPGQRRWVLAGLWLSLAGDVALLWPKQGFVPGLVAFLLAHLAYIVAYGHRVRFGARPLAFAVYAVVALAILSQLWHGVPAALQVPVVAYVVALASMAAQAAAWWRSAPGDPDARAAALGGALFLASDSLLAYNRFASALPLAPLWILSTYWAAQVCIARSLRR